MKEYIYFCLNNISFALNTVSFWIQFWPNDEIFKEKYEKYKIIGKYIDR